MKEPGLKEIELAKEDGRWDRAYSSPRSARLPEDFLEALEKNPKAQEFFQKLNRANIYAVIFRLENTKDPERRRLKIDEFVRKLERGEKFH